MSISYNPLGRINTNIETFIIMKKTQCVRQISDTVFMPFQIEETRKGDFDYVKEFEIYEGELVCKRNNQYYISLGYDSFLENDVYIPVIFRNDELNIARLSMKNK